MDVFNSEQFARVLCETGYLKDEATPADGLLTKNSLPDANFPPKLRSLFLGAGGFAADAVYRAYSGTFAYFKDATQEPDISAKKLADWQLGAWNFGYAPLLWVVSPTAVRVYNCYSSPSREDQPTEPLDIFPTDALAKLRTICGKLAADTGAFWKSPLAAGIDRNHKVEQKLLEQLQTLQNQLSVDKGLGTDLAQKLIGRCLFTQYLLDRGLLSADDCANKFGSARLTEMLDSAKETKQLFVWLNKTFNGDLFPPDGSFGAEHFDRGQLEPLRDFFSGVDLCSGQANFWPYRFDAIPVELISSIYEQFAHQAGEKKAIEQGLHYTPVNVVELILESVFDGPTPTAKVLDPACGSGVFLVESLRRLVWSKCRNGFPSREIIRETLYNQVFGIDIRMSALRVAAFSLYLAALELEPEPPEQLDELKFQPLIGKTLFCQDAMSPLPLPNESFDVVVGNPPWTYVNLKNKQRRKPVKGTSDKNVWRRSPDLAFLWRAGELAKPDARIGMVLKASPFFSSDPRTTKTRMSILNSFRFPSLVNLSLLRTEKLFPSTKGPAIIFFSNCGKSRIPETVLVGTVPWTPHFATKGVFEIGPEHFQQLSIKRIDKTPQILKIASYGTLRDVWLYERLNSDFIPLSEFLDRLALQWGDGFTVGKRDLRPAGYLKGLQMLTNSDFRPIRPPVNLAQFQYDEVQWPRNRGGPHWLDSLAASLRWMALGVFMPPLRSILPQAGPSMPRLGFCRPGWSGAASGCNTPSRIRFPFWLRFPSLRRAGRRTRT